VGGNPLSGIDPFGLWSITFGAYDGAGGQITFGSDQGNGFVTFRVGLGAGGGISWNPDGKLPGTPPKDRCEGGVILSASAKASFNAGPIQAGLEKGFARNYTDGESSSYGGPSSNLRFSNGWFAGGTIWGINANANVGGQVTFYTGK